MIDILASGLIVGAAYAALGIALTLVAKMSGVVSFAQSAVALLGCFTGLGLASLADLPPVGGLLIGVLAGAVVGGLFGAVIARWFQGADVRVKSSATIALMIGGLTLGARVFGDTPREAPSLVGGAVVALGGVRLDAGLFLALGLAAGLAVGLGLFTRKTHAGTRLMAFAERPVTAELVGIPSTLLTIAVWAAAGGISALSLNIIMSSTARSANFMSLSLLIIPALCAALVGRFQGFYLTLAAGLLLGMLEAGLLAWPAVAAYSQTAYLPVVLLALYWMNRKEVWDGQRG